MASGRRGRVVSLGVHIVDVLGRPVSHIPPGQGRQLLDEIRITAAGTAAGTSVDLAKLGAEVIAMGAIGDGATRPPGPGCGRRWRTSSTSCPIPISSPR